MTCKCGATTVLELIESLKNKPLHADVIVMGGKLFVRRHGDFDILREKRNDDIGVGVGSRYIDIPLEPPRE